MSIVCYVGTESLGCFELALEVLKWQSSIMTLCRLTSSATLKIRNKMSLWFVSNVLIATETQRVSSLPRQRFVLEANFSPQMTPFRAKLLPIRPDK